MSTTDESKPADSQKSASRILLAVWIVITQILSVGSLLPWLALAFFSLLSYPSDDWDLEKILFLGTFYSYPFIILGNVVFTWIVYKMRWHWVAWITSTLSILPLIWFLFEFFNII